MDKKDLQMILQAIKELSDKSDEQYHELRQDVEDLKAGQKDLSSRFEKMEYIQEKLIDHDEEIFHVKKKVKALS